ncbi:MULTISPECIES: hypothetical protein [Shouchella]|uniref:Uncharacterized protein n=1 Tax=Shouchella rhizosphaerae TaxID=866786 RepID=A0ABZ2CTL0_9BACI|nr:hypothetical protein [Shouchella clausii]MCY1105828.1 hypothetical protein [Shouchella clausii]
MKYFGYLGAGFWALLLILFLVDVYDPTPGVIFNAMFMSILAFVFMVLLFNEVCER